MIIFSRFEYQSCRRVHHRLQSVTETVWNAGKRRVAVIEPRQNKRNDERLKDRPRNRASDAAELPQHAEATGDGLRHVSLHRDVRVQIYAEITDGGDRSDVIIANSDGRLRNLVLPPIGGAPQHLSFGCVQLQTVTAHP